MASKQSITNNRHITYIVSFILAIGYIELRIFRFIARWIVRILSVILGIAIAYLTFYFFMVLPSPTILSQYQHIPSIAIFDRKGILLYKEWNTQRQTVSIQDVIVYRDALPSKRSMASYLASHTNSIQTEKDRYWFQKKMIYLYPQDSIAMTYMNAKIFQNGVVGIRDAVEVYAQKEWKDAQKATVKTLLNPNTRVTRRNLYARVPTETYAIRTYIEKDMNRSKTGWLWIDTSLDVQIGSKIDYISLLDPSYDVVIMDGDQVRAWTEEDNLLLAAKAVLKTSKGGEYNE